MISRQIPKGKGTEDQKREYAVNLWFIVKLHEIKRVVLPTIDWKASFPVTLGKHLSYIGLN